MLFTQTAHKKSGRVVRMKRSGHDETVEAAFLNESPETVNRVYGGGRREKLERLIRTHPDVMGRADLAQRHAELTNVRYIFSTWRMPILDPEELGWLPNLTALFYAAGSVREFAEPYLARGVRVISARAANAESVAEFTLAQVILAAKNYFSQLREPRIESRLPEAPGLFEITVSLLGAGAVGSLLARHLKSRPVNVLVFDPYLSDAVARRLGVTRCSLDEAFKFGHIVSNHLANLPATQEMIEGRHFELMRRGATFINTARGETIDQAAMIRSLQDRSDLTALLDVVTPNQPEIEQLAALPNVVVSSHIAGSIGNEVWRMADLVIEEFQRLRAGKPLKHQVTAKALRTMA